MCPEKEETKMFCNIFYRSQAIVMRRCTKTCHWSGRTETATENRVGQL